MIIMERSPHLLLAHSYWKSHLKPCDIVIDATCGNGHDTVFLAQLILENSNSLLIGLDLQQAALESTLQLLRHSLPDDYLSRILLQRICHSEIDRIPLPHPPRLIVYNLGYLPGGDKNLTTQTSTTLQSLQKALALLAPDGAISVTCYPGHAEGAREELAILNWAQTLPVNEWHVCHHRWINRPAAPSLLWIHRVASS